jgi:putative aldouronate transport system permease protein
MTHIKDRSLSSIILTIVVIIIVTVVILASAYPILHVISKSVSSPINIIKNNVTFYPRGFQLTGYEIIIKAKRIPNALKNSVYYTIVGTFINIVMTSAMAYALSKKRLTFRGTYTVIAIITMYFSGGLIPLFLLVKKLGMYNTGWAITVPGSISIFNMIILRTFFMAIPKELEESAFLDGANDVTVLLKIAIPLSTAALATIALFYAVGHWNAYMTPVIFLRERVKMPLQVLLHEIVIANRMPNELAQELSLMRGEEEYEIAMGFRNQAKAEMIVHSTLVFSLAPMMLLYPFLQRYFVKGVMIGSLKG